MMFVSIACGAISGFHSLISSGTTSKQLASEKDAKKVSYGAMIAEGAVAILAILAVGAGLGTKALSDAMAKGGPVDAFGLGFGQITRVIFGGYGGLIAMTILNAFILTTLDTATRIGRYLTQELFGIKNRYLSTFIIVALGAWLALSGQWSKIWPVFGSSNQLVAALALMVVSVWLLTRKKLVRFTAIPSLFMFLTSIGALFYQIIRFARTEDYLLTAISCALIILALFMVFEVIRILKTRRT
jgi:carbon starvation protein